MPDWTPERRAQQGEAVRDGYQRSTVARAMGRGATLREIPRAAFAPLFPAELARLQLLHERATVAAALAAGQVQHPKCLDRGDGRPCRYLRDCLAMMPHTDRGELWLVYEEPGPGGLVWECARDFSPEFVPAAIMALRRRDRAELSRHLAPEPEAASDLVAR